jgi:hypothetical protein
MRPAARSNILAQSFREPLTRLLDKVFHRLPRLRPLNLLLQALRCVATDRRLEVARCLSTSQRARPRGAEGALGLWGVCAPTV